MGGNDRAAQASYKPSGLCVSTKAVFLWEGKKQVFAFRRDILSVWAQLSTVWCFLRQVLVHPFVLLRPPPVAVLKHWCPLPRKTHSGQIDLGDQTKMEHYLATGRKSGFIRDNSFKTCPASVIVRGVTSKICQSISTAFIFVTVSSSHKNSWAEAA